MLIRLFRKTGIWALLSGLVGCGDGGEAGMHSLMRPFPYVVTECSEKEEGWTARQQLRIRQPDGTEVIAKEIITPPLEALATRCGALAGTGQGNNAQFYLPFQRLGVSADASTVAFEVTDDFSNLDETLMASEDEGIFVVGADGIGLRRIAPASRQFANGTWSTPFSPDGRTIAYSNRGSGPDGEEATQIFTIDLEDGRQTQVTNLPRMTALVYPFRFVTDDALVFMTRPGTGSEVAHLVVTDGRRETLEIHLPESVGGEFLPQFSITGTGRGVALLQPRGQPSLELFAFDLRLDEAEAPRFSNLLQLTQLELQAGFAFDALPSTDGERAIFRATANPFGENDCENQQVFSVDILGGDVHQLTHFGPAKLSGSCPFCYLVLFGLEEDAIVFDSNCDPDGGRLRGSQFFVMRPDGTELRQITDLRGVVREASRRYSVELPGPYIYPGFQ